MTKLIPLDAAIAAISALLSQATHNDPVDAGYRSCVGDALSELRAIRAIRAIDPAAIREAALREAADAKAFFHGTKTYKPIMRPWRDAIFALIGEKK